MLPQWKTHYLYHLTLGMKNYRIKGLFSKLFKNKCSQMTFLNVPEKTLFCAGLHISVAVTFKYRVVCQYTASLKWHGKNKIFTKVHEYLTSLKSTIERNSGETFKLLPKFIISKTLQRCHRCIVFIVNFISLLTFDMYLLFVTFHSSLHVH